MNIKSISDFNTLFPDNREEGETTLRQCQLVMLRLLKIFDFLCNKHHIDYFLTGGTLLGAIRHKGFIPWDDDIDVGMTRKNYEKFLKYAVPELPEDIFFQTHQTDAFYTKLSGVDARLRDKYSNFNPAKKKKSHEGLMVDIFVYDRAFFPNHIWIITMNKAFKVLSKTNHGRAKILKWISKWVPLPFVYCSNFLQFYSDNKRGTYITPKELSILIRTKFEDMDALIPASYDSYLTRQYGDYMKMPSEDKRVSHHQVNPDPFTPCDHKDVLNWQKKRSYQK